MKILIRCDSSLLIGTGHVLRCLNLADILRQNGHQVSFICRELEGNIINLVEEKQFKVIRLHAPKSPLMNVDLYSQWLAVPKQEEIDDLLNVLSHEKPNWMISDHYSLSKEWEEVCMKQGVNVFAIDDILRPHHATHLLDQSYSSKDPHPSLINSIITGKRFIGPEYALLSKAFLNLTPNPISRKEVKNILIFCGGSDPDGATFRLVQLLKSNFNNICFEIVVGSKNPFLEKISTLCESVENFNLHIQTKEMAQLLSKADLFIGAGGITTWERCYLGVPSIVFSIAENQHVFSSELGSRGIQKYLGFAKEVRDETILRSITDLISNESERSEMKKKCLELKVASKTQDLLFEFK